MKHSTLTSMKFLRLKRALGLPTYQVAGVLEMLWGFAATNAMDGGIGRFTNEDIAAFMEWPHDHNKLIEDLINAGWIDEREDCRLGIHDWEDHCPTWVVGNMKRHGKTFIPRFTKQLAKQATKQPAMAACPEQLLPNLTKPNLTQPNRANALRPEPAEAANSGSLEPTIFEFPCQGAKKTFAVCQSHLDQLASFYPGLDVVDHTRRALAYIVANPVKRKTARGMMKFLTAWMERRIDNQGGKQSQGQAIAPRFDSRPDLAKEPPRRPAYGKSDPERDPEDGLWYARDGEGREVAHDGESWLTLPKWKAAHPEGWKPEYVRRWKAGKAKTIVEEGAKALGLEDAGAETHPLRPTTLVAKRMPVNFAVPAEIEDPQMLRGGMNQRA